VATNEQQLQIFFATFNQLSKFSARILYL